MLTLLSTEHILSHMKQEMLDQKLLGIAIKQILTEKDMTQLDLSDKAGIPRATLNRKLRVGIFNYDELIRIAKVVEWPLSSIVARAEATPALPGSAEVE